METELPPCSFVDYHPSSSWCTFKGQHHKTCTDAINAVYVVWE